VSEAEETYTTGQAARILRMSDRGVRKMIDRDELEAHQDERGRHLIPQRAVHAVLEERRASGEIAAEAPQSGEEARELRERVEGLQRQLGRLEGRLELTDAPMVKRRCSRRRCGSRLSDL
jgi:excisionase family DNA binding protein